MDNPIVFWLIVLIVLGILEISTAGLVSIWFCFGALAALIIAMCSLPIWLQTAAFLFVSVLLLIFTRPILQKYLMKRTVRTNADMMIGQLAVVIEEIDNLMPSGQVKVKGQVWTARSRNDYEKIPVSDKVRVLEIEGVKLIVERYVESSPKQDLEISETTKEPLVDGKDEKDSQKQD